MHTIWVNKTLGKKLKVEVVEIKSDGVVRIKVLSSPDSNIIGKEFSVLKRNLEKFYLMEGGDGK